MSLFTNMQINVVSIMEIYVFCIFCIIMSKYGYENLVSMKYVNLYLSNFLHFNY
jgi:hypothetical protein